MNEKGDVTFGKETGSVETKQCESTVEDELCPQMQGLKLHGNKEGDTMKRKSNFSESDTPSENVGSSFHDSSATGCTSVRHNNMPATSSNIASTGTQSDTSKFSAAGSKLEPTMTDLGLVPLSRSSLSAPGTKGRVSNTESVRLLCKHIIKDMHRFGICVVDNFFGVQKGEAILNEVIAMHESGVFSDGQVVSNKLQDGSTTIRGDEIIWVDGTEPNCKYISALINAVDTLIMRCNTLPDNGMLGQYNIKGRTKAMVACYPGQGKHYVKHVDNPNNDGRCITCIYYLNKDWNIERDGGLLRIFPDGWKNKAADIHPIFDRMLFFWSDRRNPHEVQPAYKTRYAITLWYFDKDEQDTQRQREKRTLRDIT